MDKLDVLCEERRNLELALASIKGLINDLLIQINHYFYNHDRMDDL
jgi:hypothetical protein